MKLSKRRKTKKNKQTMKKHKYTYRGGSNEPDGPQQDERSIQGFLQNAAVGSIDAGKNVAYNTIEAGKNVVYNTIDAGKDAAMDVINDKIELLEDKASAAVMTGIEMLNNPVLEAKAEAAIENVGHLAKKIVDETKAPIKAGIDSTIESAEEAADKASKAAARVGINTVGSIPGVGPFVLLLDDINQASNIVNAGVNLASKTTKTVTDVASTVMDAVDESVTNPSSFVSPSSFASPSSSPMTDNSMEEEKPSIRQYGGMIRERNRVIQRLERSITKFNKPFKHRKTKKIKVNKQY